MFFFDISIQLSMFLWISIWISLDFYGYPCIDLLWILDPGQCTLRTVPQLFSRSRYQIWEITMET